MNYSDLAICLHDGDVRNTINTVNVAEVPYVTDFYFRYLREMGWRCTVAQRTMDLIDHRNMKLAETVARLTHNQPIDTPGRTLSVEMRLVIFVPNPNPRSRDQAKLIRSIIRPGTNPRPVLKKWLDKAFYIQAVYDGKGYQFVADPKSGSGYSRVRLSEIATRKLSGLLPVTK